METELLIIIPEGDNELRTEIEEALKPYGRIYENPLESLTAQDWQLIFQTVGAGFQAVGSLAAVVYLIKDKIAESKHDKIKVGKSIEESKPVDELEGKKPEQPTQEKE